MPLQPRPTIVASTRTGFASAPQTRISNLVDLADAMGGAIRRIDAARWSRPHDTVTGAQKFSTSLLYELIVGAMRGMTSGRPSSSPAKKFRPMSDMYSRSGYGAFGSISPL